MKHYILFFLLFVFYSQHIKASSPTSVQHRAKGYADLHVHMFANLGFAGAWFLGDPTKESLSDLFKLCPKEQSPSWFQKKLTSLSPYLSSFIYRDHCISQEQFYPQWNNLSHQQMWQGHLKMAHEQGLSLMIMSAVHSYVLCKILPDSRKSYGTCEDRPNIVRQLIAVNEWAEREKAWVGIAKTPEEARKLNREGKLVIILAVETENIFDHKDWEEEFQEYWNLGVRTLQIVHQFNNKLAGPAIHQRPLITAQYIRNWLRHSIFEGFDSIIEDYQTPFGNRKVEKNKRGLTEFGKTVLEKMMNKGMTIDFAHMSEKTMIDVREVLKKNNNYPFYISHGHFRDIMKEEDYGSFEKSSSKTVLESLKEVGGIFGLRTFETGTHHHNHDIENNCDGSSLSFAQAYSFGSDMHGINIALGSDFNGFIAQTKPRFSDTDAKYCAPQKIPRLQLPFDTTGLGRVDQLSSLIKDLEQMGVDLSSLMNSTENYINLWERSLQATRSSVP
jgi:microsomal dipeptidase-like Zn-dependent dipeptidase